MRKKLAIFMAMLLAVICALVLATASRETYVNYREAECSPKCWYGIVPGQSTREDARRTLTGLPFVVPLSIIEDNPSRDGLAFSWVKKWTFDVRDWIEVDESDIVSGVVVHPDGSLHLQDVIQTVGVPERVRLYDYGVEKSNVHLSLFYPNEGRAYELFVPTDSSTASAPDIKPDLPILEVEYRVPDTSPDHLKFWSSWRPNFRYYLDQTRNWPGYGPASFKPSR